MTIRDRDLNKIKIDRYLNEYVWFRGIKKPPAKVKVKVVKKGDIVTAELFEFPTKLKFKKAREEKVEKEGEKIMKKKKEEKKEEEKTETKSPEEEKKEEEKKAAVVEAGKERAKQAAKKMKHQAGGKTKQPKRQQRKALAK
jgi:ribosomal protein L31E